LLSSAESSTRVKKKHSLLARQKTPGPTLRSGKQIEVFVCNGKGYSSGKVQMDFLNINNRINVLNILVTNVMYLDCKKPVFKATFEAGKDIELLVKELRVGRRHLLTMSYGGVASKNDAPKSGENKNWAARTPPGAGVNSISPQFAEDTYGNGFIIKKEFRIDTPGGFLETRYVDVAVLDPSKHPVAFYQVGNITQAGVPIAREVKAINDIIEYSQFSSVPIIYLVK
jgi:hypothetical protein